MSKKEEMVKKGLRGVPFMGRQLRFTEPNLEDFEQASYDELSKAGRIPPGSTITAEDLIPGFMKNRKIFRLSLFYALKQESPELKLDEVPDIIAAAVEAGIDNNELQRKITEAFLLATNPSTVASVKKSWQLLDARAKAEEEYNLLNQERHVEGAQKALDVVKGILAEANSSQGSPSVSSASSQETPKT